MWMRLWREWGLVWERQLVCSVAYSGLCLQQQHQWWRWGLFQSRPGSLYVSWLLIHHASPSPTTVSNSHALAALVWVSSCTLWCDVCLCMCACCCVCECMICLNGLCVFSGPTSELPLCFQRCRINVLSSPWAMSFKVKTQRHRDTSGSHIKNGREYFNKGLVKGLYLCMGMNYRIEWFDLINFVYLFQQCESLTTRVFVLHINNSLWLHSKKGPQHQFQSNKRYTTPNRWVCRRGQVRRYPC